MGAYVSPSDLRELWHVVARARTKKGNYTGAHQAHRTAHRIDVPSSTELEQQVEELEHEIAELEDKLYNLQEENDYLRQP